MTEAAQWIAGLATGSIAVSIAIIAVAGIGFALLAGRIPYSRMMQVVIGCFILFGAGTIAGAFISLWPESEVTARQTMPVEPPTYVATDPQQIPYDPFAGAALQPAENAE